MKKLLFLASIPLLALHFVQDNIDERARLAPKPADPFNGVLPPDQNDDRGMFTVMVDWLKSKKAEADKHDQSRQSVLNLNS